MKCVLLSADSAPSVYSVPDVVADNLSLYRKYMPNPETHDYGVGLPMSSSRFNTFTQGDYYTIFMRVASGEFNIATYDSIGSVEEIPLCIVNVITC